MGWDRTGADWSSWRGPDGEERSGEDRSGSVLMDWTEQVGGGKVGTGLVFVGRSVKESYGLE